MTDIDHLLGQIGALPLDRRLSGIDDAVFAGLAEMTKPAVPRAAFGAIAGLAMGVGILAAALPAPQPARAALAPLGIPDALAPSTLLESGR